ncbi:Hypothetical protein GOX2484 [Gluconobacter oxydans 621H]|uniref:Uncharacterized protein n=1 Tax=Gluconobacter oxydans (strain 621H) TaxID=290633 RepID=Q5FN32_GLUOX|nr:Hypothetical protein GOX2484 [Gluconobacter oxydans 621H]
MSEDWAWPDTANVLHIVAQPMPHDDAYIIGTPEGLKRLRDAIDAALTAPGHPRSASVMCDDGEGYYAVVRCVSGRKMGEAPFGYTDEACKDGRPWPAWASSMVQHSVVDDSIPEGFKDAEERG